MHPATTHCARRVERTTTRALAAVAPSLEAFPWHDRRAYADWLSQTYHYVRHSTRLLACAAARFEATERGDLLHYRFLSHMGEEKKHEKLCEHDLRALSTSVTKFPERHATRMLYETQYFKIEHRDPTALFGYVLFLEALGAGQAGRRLLGLVSDAHGTGAIAFVKLHVDEDPAHLQKAYAIVEGCTDAQLALVEENVWQTARAYRALLRDIQIDEHEER